MSEGVQSQGGQEVNDFMGDETENWSIMDTLSLEYQLVRHTPVCLPSEEVCTHVKAGQILEHE